MRVTLKEIAHRKGVGWHAIRKRKEKEGWVSCGKRIVNHKPSHEFETETLSEDIRILFSNPGDLPMAERDKTSLNGSSATPSVRRQTASASVVPLPSVRQESRTPQNAPVHFPNVPAQPMQLLPEPTGNFIHLNDGNIVRTDTGEVINTGTELRHQTEEEIENEIYTRAPEWQRRKADKYLQIIRTAAGLKGTALKQLIAEWNGINPDFKTSYDSVLEARKKYAEQGIMGLLAKYGHSAGTTKIKDEYLNYFKAAYLKEGAPSVKSCWVRTLGYARSLDSQFLMETFPSPSSFIRQLTKNIPESSRYLARNGHDAWNKKYASFIDRDYSQITPGEVIVADHAQVDVAVMLPNDKVCFPWVTAWRCFKTSKWLSWILHPEAPNSDFIFQSFYYAVKEHGLPSHVYIDNGRDFRVRDFAGVRKRLKLKVDEKKTTSMLALLNITPHFALPYRAQAKPIERDFLKNKEWFSKHMPGYRGGNVTERPEILDEEIKKGHILSWEEFTKLMDQFITQVLNKIPSDGKVLQGRSPDELWETERHETRKVSDDALKLFCTRTSRELLIGRNGVRDNEFQVTYWSDMFFSLKGEKVYLRRDVKAYQTAWVFDASTDEYLCKAELVGTVSALAKTDIEKAALKAASARKNRDRKIAKSYFDMRDRSTSAETVEHLAAGVAAVNEARGYKTTVKKKVKIVRLANTAMDRVVRQEKRMQEELEDRKTGTDAKSVYYSQTSRVIQEEFEASQSEKIYLYESDVPDNAIKTKETITEDKILRAGSLEINYDRMTIKTSNNRTVNCIGTEYRILCFLMEHPGKVFSRREIMNTVYRGGYSAELRAIDVHVRRLRAKLEKVGLERYILTKRGSGYFFSAED